MIAGARNAIFFQLHGRVMVGPCSDHGGVMLGRRINHEIFRDVSNVTRIHNHENQFWWQAQYLVRLDNDK